MKSMIITICIYLLTCLSGMSQDNTEALKNQKLEAMKKLEFMTGTWEGTGWTQMGGESINTFNIHETIGGKLDGLVYLVEGHGTSEGRTTHEAIALISYDTEKAEYSFESHTFDGRSADAVAGLEGKNFIWGFDTPNGGKIKYTMNFENGQWNEKGSFSPDGETWYPFMEMTLKKIDK